MFASGRTVPEAPSAPSVAPAEPGVDRNSFAHVRQLRPHKVVVLDCQCHSFNDVEVALVRVIPGMSRQRAHGHATEIDSTGSSVVTTAPKERAEHFAEQLQLRGLRVIVEEDS